MGEIKSATELLYCTLPYFMELEKSKVVYYFSEKKNLIVTYQKTVGDIKCPRVKENENFQQMVKLRKIDNREKRKKITSEFS